MMGVRWLKKKNGKLVLQKYTGVGQNGWGHVVFGWVDVETVDEKSLENVQLPSEKAQT